MRIQQTNSLSLLSGRSTICDSLITWNFSTEITTELIQHQTITFIYKKKTQTITSIYIKTPDDNIYI